MSDQKKQQDPTVLFNQMIAEKLAATIFAISKEHRVHIATIQEAVICFSYSELGKDLEGYKRLTSLPLEGEINLLDASFFINGIDRVSPKQLDMSVDYYIQLLEVNSQVAECWNAQVMPIKTAIMREIQAKAQRNIIIPTKGKIHKINS
jgi:hypothetical protein